MIILPMISGILMMSAGVVLFFVAYMSMANNCAPDGRLQKLIDDNADQIIIISIITEVIGFMLIIIGTR